MSVSSGRVRVLALKKAEQSDEVVLRLVEMDGKAGFGPPDHVRRADRRRPGDQRNGNAGRRYPRDERRTRDGHAGVRHPQLRPQARRRARGRGGPAIAAGSLAYDLAVATTDGTKAAIGFDPAGRTLAAEMLPPEIDFGGIKFVLGPVQGPNAVVGRGQTITLPAGEFTRLYLLAAADGDQKAVFKVDGKPVEMLIQDWGGYIGQWDNRKWNVRQEPVPPPAKPQDGPARSGQTAGVGTPSQPRMRTVQDYAGLVPGFTKRAPVAWFSSHRHLADGTNDLYMYSYLFIYSIDLPADAKTFKLPDNEKVRIMAVTMTDEIGPVVPAQPLFDTLGRTPIK